MSFYKKHFFWISLESNKLLGIDTVRPERGLGSVLKDSEPGACDLCRNWDLDGSDIKIGGKYMDIQIMVKFENHPNSDRNTLHRCCSP